MARRFYASIGAGPLRLGRSIGGGQSPDPESKGAMALIAWWFVIAFLLFWIAPFVTGIMIGLFPIVFIVAVILEARTQHRIKNGTHNQPKALSTQPSLEERAAAYDLRALAHIDGRRARGIKGNQRREAKIRARVAAREAAQEV